MNTHLTVVIRIPTDADSRAKMRQGLDLLRPYQTGMSQEDEMTILDLIENHPDFDNEIGDYARRTSEILTVRADRSVGYPK